MDERETQQDLLTDETWDARERKETRMTLRVWAQETGKMQVPFVEVRESAGEYMLGGVYAGGQKLDLGRVTLVVSMRHPTEIPRRQ